MAASEQLSGASAESPPAVESTGRRKLQASGQKRLAQYRAQKELRASHVMSPAMDRIGAAIIPQTAPRPAVHMTHLERQQFALTPDLVSGSDSASTAAPQTEPLRRTVADMAAELPMSSSDPTVVRLAFDETAVTDPHLVVEATPVDLVAEAASVVPPGQTVSPAHSPAGAPQASQSQSPPLSGGLSPAVASLSPAAAPAVLPQVSDLPPVIAPFGVRPFSPSAVPVVAPHVSDLPPVPLSGGQTVSPAHSPAGAPQASQSQSPPLSGGPSPAVALLSPAAAPALPQVSDLPPVTASSGVRPFSPSAVPVVAPQVSVSPSLPSVPLSGGRASSPAATSSQASDLAAVAASGSSPAIVVSPSARQAPDSQSPQPAAAPAVVPQVSDSTPVPAQADSDRISPPLITVPAAAAPTASHDSQLRSHLVLAEAELESQNAVISRLRQQVHALQTKVNQIESTAHNSFVAAGAESQEHVLSESVDTAVPAADGASATSPTLYRDLAGMQTSGLTWCDRWSNIVGVAQAIAQRTQAMQSQVARCFDYWKECESKAGMNAEEQRWASLRQHVRSLMENQVFAEQRLLASLNALGEPVSIDGVESKWLPRSAVVALVDREVKLEREETKRLVTDHLKLQSKLEAYQQQIRSLTKDLAHSRARAGSGGASALAVPGAPAPPPQTQQVAKLTRKVESLQRTLEEKNELIEQLREAVSVSAAHSARLQHDLYAVQAVKESLLEDVSAKSRALQVCEADAAGLRRRVQDMLEETRALRAAVRLKETRIAELLEDPTAARPAALIEHATRPAVIEVGVQAPEVDDIVQLPPESPRRQLPQTPVPVEAKSSEHVSPVLPGSPPPPTPGSVSIAMHMQTPSDASIPPVGLARSDTMDTVDSMDTVIVEKPPQAEAYASAQLAADPVAQSLLLEQRRLHKLLDDERHKLERLQQNSRKTLHDIDTELALVTSQLRSRTAHIMPPPPEIFVSIAPAGPVELDVTTPNGIHEPQKSEAGFWETLLSFVWSDVPN